MDHRLLPLLALFALYPLAACEAEEDPEQEASDIQHHIQDELVGEIDAISADTSALEMYLCRRGDLGAGVFSLRSFEGRLCESNYVDGLQLVGGAALLICWDGDHEDFQDSHCAENALDEYGLDEYDRDAVVQQMSAVINELIEQSGAGGNPAYATAKLLFCSLPRSLFGSAATVYDLWCAS